MQFRTRLVKHYLALKTAYVQKHYDRCGIQTGHFCETLLRLLQHRLTGSFVPFGTRIPNFIDECDKLTKQPQTAGHEGLRVIMPRALAFAYSLRSKRGFGHVAGDVDANAIDAGTCVRAADWCLSELIREVHSLPIEQAQAILDAISARQLPAVWSLGDRKRVLHPGFDYREQTLLLLYESADGSATVDQLFKWTDHKHKTRYTRNVLQPQHADRLVEYDEDNQTVILLPPGEKEVEDNLLPRLPASWRP